MLREGKHGIRSSNTIRCRNGKIADRKYEKYGFCERCLGHFCPSSTGTDGKRGKSLKKMKGFRKENERYERDILSEILEI